jgi:hypothetical protein
MTAQLIGEALASALDQLALDVREQALQGEQARMKGPGRDWNAIYGQLVATDRGREDNPCQSPTREGGPRLVLVKGAH